MPPDRRRSASARTTIAPSGSADPLAGIERVFIDGSNLLHALARGRASGETGPASAIIGRIRAAFPPSVILDLVFDGPSWNDVKGRLATGLRVSHSGRASADQLIIEGVEAQLATDGPAGTWGILVVTDDRGLRDIVNAKGARVAGTAWLAGRMGRLTEEAPRRYTPKGGGASGSTGGEFGGAGAISGRGRGGPGIPRPKAGTTIGHRRPPRAPDQPDRD
jgi:hypothetical protein